MNEPIQDPTGDTERGELRAAVHALPGPAPDPAYRDRVRRAFVRGVTSTGGEAASASTAGAEAFLMPASPAGPARPAGAAVSARPRSRALVWGTGMALAAVLAVALLLAAPLPVWTVDSSMSPPGLMIDGAAADLTESHALRPGTRVENPGPGAACVAIEGAVTVLLAPGTGITLGTGRGRFGSAVLTAEIHEGMFLARTGPDFPGGGLEIATGRGDFRVTGTTFGMSVEADSTCVCVFAGAVEARTPDGGRYVVSAGERYSFFTSAPPHAWPLEPVRPGEIGMLRLLGPPSLGGASRP